MLAKIGEISGCQLRGSWQQDGGVKAEAMAWFEAAPSAAKRRRYLVGVSGGADSVALVHLLHEAGFGDVVVCHLDHGLRGRASVEDAKFVRRLAAKLGFSHEGGRVDLNERMADWGVSMETAGRRARHEFFSECGRKHRCHRLLLGHHADDQAETVLWNLLRGSRGPSGMAVEQVLDMSGREMTVLRPLLGMRRDELRQWLKQRRLKWREDASNAEPVAVRNRLRHEVLPKIAEITGRDVVLALSRAADSNAEIREVEQWAVEQAAAIDPQGRLHVPRLRELPEAIQRACVHAYLKSHDVPELDRAVVTRALSLLEPGAASCFQLPGGRTFRRRQGRLFVD